MLGIDFLLLSNTTAVLLKNRSLFVPALIGSAQNGKSVTKRVRMMVWASTRYHSVIPGYGFLLYMVTYVRKP